MKNLMKWYGILFLTMLVSASGCAKNSSPLPKPDPPVSLDPPNPPAYKVVIDAHLLFELRNCRIFEEQLNNDTNSDDEHNKMTTACHKLIEVKKALRKADEALQHGHQDEAVSVANESIEALKQTFNESLFDEILNISKKIRGDLPNKRFGGDFKPASPN